MNRQQPAVWIFRSRSVAADAFQPLLWGMEEEGIPFEIRETGEGPVRDLAKQAADGSPLNVGIAIGGNEIVLHHTDLATPLFSLTTRPWPPFELRRMGINGARLVKGQPLVLENRGITAAPVPHPVRDPREVSESLIHLILDELFRESGGKFRS